MTGKMLKNTMIDGSSGLHKVNVTVNPDSERIRAAICVKYHLLNVSV